MKPNQTAVQETAKSNTTDLITIPVEAEITYADCKTYSQNLTKYILGEVAVKMAQCGISSNCIFADVWAQPVISNDPSPYKMLMNVLKQFASISYGAYTATIELERAKREIAYLQDQLVQIHSHE